MSARMVHGDTSAVFSDPVWRPVICALFLVALMIQSILTGQRTPTRWSQLKRLQATAIAVMGALHSSLLFILMSSFVTLGLGTSRSAAVCHFANYICIVGYSAAKGFTTWFLIERARLVHSPHLTRRENRLYQFNMSLLLVWAGIFAAMFCRHIDFIRPSDGECKIGLGMGVIKGVIIIDFVLSTYLTLLFAYPVFAIAHRTNATLRNLAIRSALACALCLCSISTNLLISMSHGGMELSWICLSSCTLDTTWCAIVLVTLANKRERGELVPADSTSKVARDGVKRIRLDRGVSVTVDERKVTSEPAEDVEEGVGAPALARPERAALAGPGDSSSRSYTELRGSVRLVNPYGDKTAIDT